MFKALLVVLSFQFPVYAQESDVSEFVPYAPGSQEALEAFDRDYREATGEDTGFTNAPPTLLHKMSGCYRITCTVFANVVKSEQMLYLYWNGKFLVSWKVSTARKPHSTPDFDGNPSGPFYPGKFTSKKYPGGDYMGLGNMPYAVFYNGHYAIHGTPAINGLGRPASHGCVRSHPSYAEQFSRLVRNTGAESTWVTVSQNRIRF